jgi:hypothetical protein
MMAEKSETFHFSEVNEKEIQLHKAIKAFRENFLPSSGMQGRL